MFLTLERMFQHVHRNIILDHIDQPCAGLGCVEIEFPWKPHRIEFCASINNYPQSADRLYFSHSINCISFLTKTVFPSLHQQYFSHSINHISQLINCISLTVSAIFLSLYQHYFSHLIACITWTSPVSTDCTFLILLYRFEFWAGINNYPQSVDRAPGGWDSTAWLHLLQLHLLVYCGYIYREVRLGGAT